MSSEANSDLEASICSSVESTDDSECRFSEASLEVPEEDEVGRDSELSAEHDCRIQSENNEIEDRTGRPVREAAEAAKEAITDLYRQKLVNCCDGMID